MPKSAMGSDEALPATSSRMSSNMAQRRKVWSSTTYSLLHKS